MHMRDMTRAYPFDNTPHARSNAGKNLSQNRTSPFVSNRHRHNDEIDAPRLLYALGFPCTRRFTAE